MTLNAADAVYMGSTRADAVYMGDVKVWPSGASLEWTFDAGAEGWKVMTADEVTAEGTFVNLRMIDPQIGDGYIWTDGGSTVFNSGEPPEPFGANFILRTGGMDIPAGTYTLVAEVQSDLDPAHSSASTGVGDPAVSKAILMAAMTFGDPPPEVMAAIRVQYEYLAEMMVWLANEYVEYLVWRLSNLLKPFDEYQFSTPPPIVPDIEWPATVAVEVLLNATASTVADYSTSFVTASIGMPEAAIGPEVIVWPGGQVDALTIMLSLSDADNCATPWRLSRVALVPVGSEAPVEVPNTVTPDWTETPTDILEIVTEVQAGVQKPPATAEALEWTFDTDAAGWFDVNDPPDPLDPVTTPGTPAGWADGHAIVQVVDQGGTDLAGFLWYTPEPIHLKAGTYHIVAEIQRAPGYNFGTGTMRGSTWWMVGYAGATMEEALAPALALESVPGGADGWMWNVAPESTDLVILDTSTLPPTTDSTGPSTITIPSDGDWFFGFAVQLMTLFAGAGAPTGELWLHRVTVLHESGNVVQVS